jgi:uncharacterized Ntn-hydrolase superfamily protein
VTFSMVARCIKTLELGVCVSTAVPAVGNRVPHVEAGVGAIATQAHTNVLYGIEGLRLLKEGFSPQVAMDAMLKKDQDREFRQVIIIDAFGRTASFTGKETQVWKGHRIGKEYVVAGNLLTRGEVLEAMTQTFEDSKGWLAERLMKTLEAGQEAGGDRRGRVSAALLVASHSQTKTGPILNLHVDEHQEPVKELRRLLEAHKKEIKTKGSSFL